MLAAANPDAEVDKKKSKRERRESSKDTSLAGVAATPDEPD